MKKVLGIVLAAVLAVTCLVGCGKTDNGNEPKATEGASNEKFFIGATGPLTGGASSYGISVNRGATIAIEEINAAGGLNGHQFDYEMMDDKAEAGAAGTAYTTLYDKGMQISLGSVTSDSCFAFATAAKDDNLFFITPSASRQDIIETGDNAFRVCFGDPDQGVLAADYLVNDKKCTDIGVVYDISDTYSSGIFAAFEQQMKTLNKTFKVTTFDTENKTKFSTQAEALKDCDAIFLPIYYNEAALIVKTACGKGFDGLVLGCDGLDGIAKYIDSTVTVEINYITPFDVESKDAKVTDFVAKYKEKYNGELPDQFAADGYDAVMAIFNSMKAANITDVKITPSDLCDKVVAAITASTFSYEGLTGAMVWDATGACTKVPVIVKINN